MIKVFVSSAIIILTGTIAGTWLAIILAQPDDQFARCRTGAVAGGTAQIGGPFELLNSDGQLVTDDDIVLEPTLIYFGYTFCPDVCPLDTVRNAEAIDLLAQKGISATPVFISIDPERDTPEIVGDFAQNIHKKMIGLTGTPEQVKVVSQAFKAYFKAHQTNDDAFYLVDHSTFSYLILPEYGFVEYFKRNLSPEIVAETTACFIEHT
ncbi:MAG: SCO family protein [Aestuariivita sp.]|nr:SCO family protein [Aestuariivita sp.]